MRRVVFLSAFFCLVGSAVFGTPQSATGAKTQPWEKVLGVWRGVPGPDEPSTLKIQHEGGGIKMSFGCKQDGSCQGMYIVGNYETASKRNGKVVSAISHKVSDDGKKMVWTVRNAEGKTFEYTYEKVE